MGKQRHKEVSSFAQTHRESVTEAASEVSVSKYCSIHFTDTESEAQEDDVTGVHKPQK